jgi:hypothetical protein
LFLWNPEEQFYFLWGQAPAEGDGENSDAEEKWGRISDWSRTEKQRVLPEGYYWEIVGAEVRKSGLLRPPESARRTQRRDAGAILTKGSGQSG